LDACHRAAMKSPRYEATPDESGFWIEVAGDFITRRVWLDRRLEPGC